ncbi:MAG: transporter substrate-binding domain-containing protein [Alphaproteobacteria bacterium]
MGAVVTGGKNVIARILSLFVVIVLWAGGSHGPAKAVELVTGNNYFPYADERIPGGGLATVLVKAIFEKMGHNATVSFAPWPDGFQATREGRFLATFPYIKTPEREAEFLYTDELFSVRPHIFMNFTNAPGLTQPSDLAGKILCVPVGWGIDEYLKDVTASGQVRVYDQTTVVGCFQLLAQGKVDAISIDRRLGTAAARAVQEGAWFKVRRLTIDSSPNYMIIPKSLPGAQEWIKRFNAAKDSLRMDGTVARLIQTYYENYP